MGKKYKLSQLLEDEWNKGGVSLVPSAPIQDLKIKQPTLLNELGQAAQKSCSGAEASSCSGADLENAVVASFLAAKEQPTSAPEQKHWVETYHPSNRPQYSYYRYVWMEGRKLRHLHLSGNAKGDRALALKERVENAIANGSPPSAIAHLIKSNSQLP